MKTLEASAETFFAHRDVTAPRRVMVRIDEYFSLEDTFDKKEWADEWENLERMVQDYGAWGFICEKLSPAGEWETVDSCWGFIGDSWDSILTAMRDYMGAEFKEIEPTEEF